jgi:hypothetical protein
LAVQAPNTARLFFVGFTVYSAGGSGIGYVTDVFVAAGQNPLGVSVFSTNYVTAPTQTLVEANASSTDNTSGSVSDGIYYLAGLSITTISITLSKAQNVLVGFEMVLADAGTWTLTRDISTIASSIIATGSLSASVHKIFNITDANIAAGTHTYTLSHSVGTYVTAYLYALAQDGTEADNYATGTYGITQNFYSGASASATVVIPLSSTAGVRCFIYVLNGSGSSVTFTLTRDGATINTTTVLATSGIYVKLTDSVGPGSHTYVATMAGASCHVDLDCISNGG